MAGMVLAGMVLAGMVSAVAFFLIASLNCV